MPKSLIIPGVSVSAQFDVAPPLPARSGILGCVGVVDNESPGVRGVKTRQELLELFGPATLFSLPEAFLAIGNGVSEVVVSPVASRSGAAARLVLKDKDGDDVAVLRARAVGPWGNKLALGLKSRLASDGVTVRNVALQVFHDGKLIESHDGLVLREGEERDLFNVLNTESRVLTAIDPLFETDLPRHDAARVAFEDNAARAATGTLFSGGAALIRLSSKSQVGRVGNTASIRVRHGRAVLALADPTGQPSVRLRARRAGEDSTSIQVEVRANAAGGVDVLVVGAAANLRTYAALSGVPALVNALKADPDVEALAQGNLLPAVTARTALAATRTLLRELASISTAQLEDHPSAEALVAAFQADGNVDAVLVGPASALPDVEARNDFFLAGGRDAGLSRAYRGQSNSDADVLEFVPAPGSDGATTRFQVLAGSRAGSVRLVIGTDVGNGFVQREEFDALAMDPDSDRYLVAVLREKSQLVRALDLYVREHANHWPVDTKEPLAFSNGAAPLLDAYLSAIEELAKEDAVDLVAAGLQGWADPALDGIAVQRALLGHAKTQADAARPRIVLGSIRPSADGDFRAILDHATQLADRRFVLVAPSGNDGAIAGLLGNLEFFQSPTFKSVANVAGALPRYSDSELDKLIGPEGNVCVIQARRGRGTVCMKGIASDGFQISVTRVADRCIREVKAIADRFIGELNNAESRNALRQMIVATFTQLERDGALVPSVDGKSPAFQVEVYASQNDAAGGIVRIDIAVRPVRAIDYVYATIRVRN